MVLQHGLCVRAHVKIMIRQAKYISKQRLDVQLSHRQVGHTRTWTQNNVQRQTESQRHRDLHLPNWQRRCRQWTWHLHWPHPLMDAAYGHVTPTGDAHRHRTLMGTAHGHSTSMGKPNQWAQAKLAAGTGKADHGHGQNPTTVTDPEDAATSMDATAQWAMGTGSTLALGSLKSPYHGTVPNGQGATGNRQQADQKQIHSRRLDRLPDCQATDRHARAIEYKTTIALGTCI